MRVTKLGHCCLLIEEQGLRILTDPGAYSTAQNDVEDIDLVLITHEHADHLHIESLQQVLEKSPGAKVITNNGVGKILREKGLAFALLTHGDVAEVAGLRLEAFGEKHAEIHESIPPVENTGYFIGPRLFYPGDAFTVPPKPVEILALPVAGPWMKISEAIAYAKAVRPKTSFPVHDGMLKEGREGPVHVLPSKALPASGIGFVPMKEGDLREF